MPTITKDPDGESFDCADGDTILRAALRAGLGMPYSCNTGSCGNCRFELLEGKVTHLRADAPAWSERELKRNRWLGCQAAPEGNCRVKFRAMEQYVPDHRPAMRQAELTGKVEVTRDITEFEFRIGGNPAFSPGQYALFHVPGVDGPRAYSMSNLAADGTWRFMIKKTPEGAATGWLFDTARPGDTLTLDGPYGTAYLREDSPRDIVLLAGGSGLSPMVSIARGASEGGMLADREMHFFYGGRQTEDLFGTASLPFALGERVSFTEALSDPGPGVDWQGRTGFLHDVVQAEMGERLKDCEIYFAGPAIMSAAVQKMAHEAGVPQDQLHFDEFF
jgi:toluene monooxygenase electron transfer component